MKPRRIVVVERKLGRERAWGTQEPGRIEIDARLRGRRRLTVLVHELVHEGLPRMAESAVERLAGLIGRELWRQGYRRTE